MGVTLPCRDIFDSCSLEVVEREWGVRGGGEGAGTTGIYWREARGAAEHPTIYSFPHNKNSSSPKC